jgi:hypothetical protein
MNDLAAPLRDPQLLRKLRWLAALVRALIVLGAIGFVGIEVWCWSAPERSVMLLQQVASVSPVRISTQVRLLGALCSLVPAVVVLLALRRLWEVFTEYGHGRVFSRRALLGLRGFARWLLVDTVVSPAYDALLSVVATWENGPGRRLLQLNFGSEEYVTLMVGLVILAISTVMVEAARVAEDNEGFV